ncbi:DHS-like NAD/FAD-binding domain-containing protein [Mycena galopus ATCC 62051]|nr:DHS-like NAD/FAD-binding domain-containing protein [Mycena galopus ATCC 62051]
MATVFVPLDPSAGIPISPSFLQVSANPALQLQKAIKAILKAKRIVVVCGAGISVKAGIPDFRSPEGLFQTLKRDNPKEVLASGKDLFDASVFHSENTTSLFYQMIARLSELSNAAEPTAFHNLLRALDDRGKLLRVYSQNIDSLEQKCGLSFGVPEFQERRSKPRTPKSKSKAAAATVEAEPVPVEPVASTSRLPTPPLETPRCIPLHGTLQTVHCQTCNHSFALADHFVALELGTPPACPECTAMEETRQLVGKRARGVGRLRPSVVLYNEAHKDGEGVGDVVRRDLLGLSGAKGKGRSAGADLLLVVGTSLRVPGTKRMVREFAKAVRVGKDAGSNRPSPSLAAAAGAPEEEREPPFKTVYLNLDFPVPTREWEGVFDAWLQGDAQLFAEMLQAEIDEEARVKEAASEKRRRKEKEKGEYLDRQGNSVGGNGSGKKRKAAKGAGPESAAKRRKTVNAHVLPTPPHSRPAPASSQAPQKKIFLTIPARRYRRLIPEVYITTRPSHSTCLLPTPESTPPRKTARSKARGKRKIALKSLTATPASTPAPTPASESELTEEDDVLPTFLEDDVPSLQVVREAQYGLRTSRSSSRSRA